MKLRFDSWAALVVIGLAGCGDDGTGGAGGTAGSTTGNTTSTKSASSASATSASQTTTTASSNATATTDASSSVSASSTSSGQMLQLCGVDDPGGEEASCDPAAEYCYEMNGGIIASSQFECRPKPAGCAGPPTCACVDDEGCECTMEGQMVRITCNFPG